MKQTFFIPILILAFSFTVFAQISENLCPKIIIKSPETVSPDEIFKVSASFENETQPSTSKFDWTIIIGDEVSKIKESGIIEIDPKNLEKGGLIILLAESLDKKCPETVLNKVYVIPNTGNPLKIDEYSKLDWNDEKARLANVAVSMKNYKDAELMIEFVFEKKTSPATKKARLLKVFKFLTETRGFDKKRITIFLSESDIEGVLFLPMPENLVNSYGCLDCFIIRGEDLEKIAALF